MDIDDALRACRSHPRRHAVVEFPVNVGRLSGVDHEEAAEAIAALAEREGIGYEIEGRSGLVGSTLLLKLEGEASRIAAVIQALVEAAHDLKELRNPRSSPSADR